MNSPAVSDAPGATTGERRLPITANAPIRNAMTTQSMNAVRWTLLRASTSSSGRACLDW